ncbi:hypothetical protein [Streptomyces avermitilis]|uniref:hypothetical protein n=1 Tax=Streptomyces avermitilis TaxID=33903 RepID=UPI00382E93F3
MRIHADELIDPCRSARHPLVQERVDVETLCRAMREARLDREDSYSWDRENSSLTLVM